MPGANKLNRTFSTNNPKSIRIAVIESNLTISGHACTVFHVMLEDDMNHFSLVRFIQDFKELDSLLCKHFPKLRIPLPKPAKRSFTFNLKKKKKNNAQRLEAYLYHYLRHSPLGRSSLLRDFLSAQRDEDRIISKQAVNQLVAHHQVTQIPPITMSKKRKRFDSSLPPSPPISITQFPEYERRDSGLTCSSIKEAGLCSSFILPQEDLQQEYKHTINDYQLIKVLGKGATGKVILVREQYSRRLFALKTITKSWSITKREVDHIRMERDILASLSAIHHPFLIRLDSAFQDRQNLYLVLDYHAGADLATLLQRYICFPPDQCRLYAAEIVMGLQELHRNCILYRDLKPENVLLAADGHIVLTDFGLSKMFADNQDRYDHRTATFCGTPEYLAPEIILQEDDYSYAADFWSLGTMLYEMLTGVTPFAADTPEAMYDRVLSDDPSFPETMEPEAIDLIAGLLERDPYERLGAGINGVFELRTHAYFSRHLNWKDVHAKRIQPRYVPLRTSETDLSNFDPDFLQMSTHIKEETDEAVELRQKWLPDTCPAGLTEHAFRGYSYIEPEDARQVGYESELSFSSNEYIHYDEYDDDEEDAFYYSHSANKVQDSEQMLARKARLMSPSSFNYNQNIRNSLEINSSVKDSEISAWRS